MAIIMHTISNSVVFEKRSIVKKSSQYTSRFLHKILFPAKLLQYLCIHIRNIIGLGFIVVSLIAKNTSLHLKFDDIIQPNVKIYDKIRYY